MTFDDPFRCFLPYPDAPVKHAVAGPLAGLTLAVKDLFDIKGYPTGAGSPLVLAQSGIKTRTAPVVTAATPGRVSPVRVAPAGQRDPAAVAARREPPARPAIRPAVWCTAATAGPAALSSFMPRGCSTR